MENSIIVFLFPRIKCGENRTQYQRAKQACEQEEVYFLTRQGVCDAIRADAMAVEKTGESIFYRVMFPFWLVWRVIIINREYQIRYIHCNHTPQTIVAGFVLNCLGYTWIADIYDSPHIGLDLEGSIDRPIRMIARIYNYVLIKTTEQVLTDADLVIVAMVPTILERYNIHPSDDNVLQITNGVSIEQTRRSLSINTSNQFTLIYVGPVRKERAIDTVFDSLELISSNIEYIEIKLVGKVREKDEQWLKERISDLNSIEVVLKGEVPHGEALAEISAATVGLCPLSLSVENYRAAYPIKMFEYMALGKPTIATRTEGTEMILQDGTTGFLVDADNPESMAEAILKLYNSPELCTQMGETAAGVAEQYDWEDINQKISERVDEIVV